MLYFLWYSTFLWLSGNNLFSFKVFLFLRPFLSCLTWFSTRWFFDLFFYSTFVSKTFYCNWCCTLYKVIYKCYFLNIDFSVIVYPMYLTGFRSFSLSFPFKGGNLLLTLFHLSIKIDISFSPLLQNLSSHPHYGFILLIIKRSSLYFLSNFHPRKNILHFTLFWQFTPLAEANNAFNLFYFLIQKTLFSNWKLFLLYFISKIPFCNGTLWSFCYHLLAHATQQSGPSRRAESIVHRGKCLAAFHQF